MSLNIPKYFDGGVGYLYSMKNYFVEDLRGGQPHIVSISGGSYVELVSDSVATPLVDRPTS